MATKYPNEIDGPSEIREVVDRDPNYKIDSRDHNDLRSAVIAIETTLGVNPQGLYGSVADRIDDGYAMISLHAAGAIPRHSDDDIDADEKTGSTKAISAGTVNSQVQKILDYVNEIHSVNGASLVGATGFTSAGNNYVFSEETVQGQIEEAADFIDSNVDFLKKSFHSYIVNGMEVMAKSYSGGAIIVDVVSGDVALQGQLLHYVGEPNRSFAMGVETIYVYAYKDLNTVVVDFMPQSSFVLDNINTICLLAEITVDPMLNFHVVDLRRFGMFTNNKNCFTVGNAPSEGYDGYGYDFNSLKSAAKYITILQNSNMLLGPNKILLVDEITIDNELEANIELPKNTEIDGSGNVIYYSAKEALFKINEDNITIRNINIITDFLLVDDIGYFAFAAETKNISNLKILDCKISSEGNFDAKFFMKIGDTYSIDGLIVRNNNMAIGKKWLDYYFDGGTSIDLIKNAIIDGNIIYATDILPAGSLSNGIVVGSYSKVINNIIRGGYSSGIEIIEGAFTDVQGNTIDGKFVMESGISFSCSGELESNHNVSHNSISGVKYFGIDCVAGSGYSKSFNINNNIIDNTGNPQMEMISINGSNLVDVCVFNNMVFSPGAGSGVCTIKGANQVVGNYIECVSSSFGYSDSFLICISRPGSVVSENIIKNSYGVGIYIENNGHGSVINGNIICDTISSSANCISVHNSDYVNISGNYIIGNDVAMRDRGGIYLEACNKSNIYGNSICNIEGTAILTEDICFGNSISENLISNVLNGIDCGSNSAECIVRNNYITYDSSIVFATQDGIVGVGNNSIIEGNYIYHIGQGSSNFAIKPSGTENISIGNNFILCDSSKRTIGIDCAATIKAKVTGNCLTDTHRAVLCGDSSGVLNNKIFNASYSCIENSGDYSNIMGNHIFSSASEFGIKNHDVEGAKISENYIDMSGVNSKIILNSFSSNCIIEGNYLINRGGGIIVEESGIISNLNSTGSTICSNYIIERGVNSSYYCCGIYSSYSGNTLVNSNYIFLSGGDKFYNIFNEFSSDNKICNNYLFGPGQYAIYLGASVSEHCERNLISGNYIYVNTTGSVAKKVIDVSNGYVKQVNLCGNFIYVEHTNVNTVGVNIGDTTDRNILFSSNMINIKNMNVKSVYISNSASIKVIGNVVIGGVDPGVALWSPGYINNNQDNIFVVS